MKSYLTYLFIILNLLSTAQVNVAQIKRSEIWEEWHPGFHFAPSGLHLLTEPVKCVSEA